MKKIEILSWEVQFPLLTNPHIVRAWVKAMAVTYVFCMLILGPVFIGTGEAENLPMLALVFLCVVLGLMLAGFLILLVVFGNRSRAKFTLSETGIFYESLDKRARILSRMAVLAGGLSGNPAVAGAGLLSMSNERINLPWEVVFEAIDDPKHHTIRLRNQYRDLLHLYCSPESFGAARERVRACVDRKGGEKSGGDARSPLPGAILSTALVIGACMPLYALVEIAGLHLMVPLLIMIFSLAMIWMIPLFAWVVLPLAAYIPVYLVYVLSGTRTIKLVSTYTYHKYELLDAGEWIVISLATAGLFYLCRISVRSLKGKYVPVLMRG